jgi:hypothetical protein
VCPVRTTGAADDTSSRDLETFGSPAAQIHSRKVGSFQIGTPAACLPLMIRWVSLRPTPILRLCEVSKVGERTNPFVFGASSFGKLRLHQLYFIGHRATIHLLFLKQESPIKMVETRPRTAKPRAPSYAKLAVSPFLSRNSRMSRLWHLLQISGNTENHLPRPRNNCVAGSERRRCGSDITLPSFIEDVG